MLTLDKIKGIYNSIYNNYLEENVDLDISFEKNFILILIDVCDSGYTFRDLTFGYLEDGKELNYGSVKLLDEYIPDEYCELHWAYETPMDEIFDSNVLETFEKRILIVKD